jgi:hypothetical protein
MIFEKIKKISHRAFETLTKFTGQRMLMAKKPLSWEERAKRLLKAELAKADMGYRDLAERLEKHGMKETQASFANKISRGTFSATFLLASLVAIGAGAVRLEDI